MIHFRRMLFGHPLSGSGSCRRRGQHVVQARISVEDKKKTPLWQFRLFGLVERLFLKAGNGTKNDAMKQSRLSDSFHSFRASVFDTLESSWAFCMEGYLL